MTVLSLLGREPTGGTTLASNNNHELTAFSSEQTKKLKAGC
jgi:hypothetical protein